MYFTCNSYMRSMIKFIYFITNAFYGLESIDSNKCIVGIHMMIYCYMLILPLFNVTWMTRNIKIMHLLNILFVWMFKQKPTNDKHLSLQCIVYNTYDHHMHGQWIGNLCCMYEYLQLYNAKRIANNFNESACHTVQ